MTASITPFPIAHRPLISVDPSKFDRTRTAFIFHLPGVIRPASIGQQLLDDDVFFSDDVRSDQR